MKSIRVKNLRSLKDTKEIPIKKINILVGSNSSGKSTFLRIFPLLKQSINKKINGPILWCGDDDDYVDFGSFNEAVNYSTKEKCIKLTFIFDVNLESNRYGYTIIRRNRKLDKVKIEFSIKSNTESGYDYISQIQTLFRKNNIVVKFSEKNEIDLLKLNGEDIVLNEKDDEYFAYYYEQLLFDLSLNPIRKYAEKNIRKIFNLDKGKENEKRKFEDYIFYIYNTKINKGDIKHRVKKELEEEIEKVYKNNEADILKFMLLYNFPNYYYSISNYLKLYFRRVYYIAPVRATAERYYPLRNLAVNEVDCRGKNLPVFLNSLSKKSFSKFQNWTKENLGFEVIKSTSEGHVSLKIQRVNQEKAVNLSDTGFGYSQILPIVTQLWYIANQSEEDIGIRFGIDGVSAPTTIVIEQPELHLHPALQAKLIDIIAKVASQSNVNFIIETHSETMINRIGHIIENNIIKHEEVGITIFEKEIGDNNTIVKQGGYDADGYLEGWPIGFFEPEEE